MVWHNTDRYYIRNYFVSLFFVLIVLIFHIYLIFNTLSRLMFFSGCFWTLPVPLGHNCFSLLVCTTTSCININIDDSKLNNKKNKVTTPSIIVVQTPMKKSKISIIKFPLLYRPQSTHSLENVSMDSSGIPGPLLPT